MVSLVPLTIKDYAVLERIHRACFPDGWDQETFGQLLGEKSTCGWMAMSVDDLPVGFILARVFSHEAEILTFAVHPTYQGNGIGRLLLTELMSFLRSVKCKKIFLEVAIDNDTAIKLYNTMGFQNVGTRPNYYKRNSHTYISAFIMAFEDRM